MELQAVSDEIIKPSSPTPDHLRHYTLSFLDQISPRAYSPFLYYYALNDSKSVESNHNDRITQISKKLKKALSQALTLYYPLAGRFIDVNKSLECNDEGVPYKEARVVNARLDEVLKILVPSELNKLLPFEIDEIAELPVGVQLNTFGCGGIAIGVCITHRLCDALSCLTFIEHWMAIARGENIETLARPIFDSSDLFPPKKDITGYDPSLSITKNMCTENVTKRFLLNAKRIEALRSEYEETTKGRGEVNNDLKPRRLSRIEAVCAFIWARFAASTKLAETEAPEKLYVILEAVNIRPKFEPPLPQHSFGNYYTTSATSGFIKNITGGAKYGEGLARKIGDDVRRIDKGFVEFVRVFGDEYFETLKRETDKFMNGETFVFVFSSLCRFPLYEADFGWGKPTWVSSAARGFVNVAGFMDNKAGDGIEAYICLKPKDMERLEVDKEFLDFISIT